MGGIGAVGWQWCWRFLCFEMPFCEWRWLAPRLFEQIAIGLFDRKVSAIQSDFDVLTAVSKCRTSLLPPARPRQTCLPHWQEYSARLLVCHQTVPITTTNLSCALSMIIAMYESLPKCKAICQRDASSGRIRASL